MSIISKVKILRLKNTIKSGLYILTLLVALPAGTFAQTEGETTDKEPIAEGKEKWLGNIHSQPQIENFTSYWNQITPENGEVLKALVMK